jgi:hypothetical protein
LEDGLLLLTELGGSAAGGVVGLEKFIIAGIFDEYFIILGRGSIRLEGGFDGGWAEAGRRDNHLVPARGSRLEGRRFRRRRVLGGAFGSGHHFHIDHIQDAVTGGLGVTARRLGCVGVGERRLHGRGAG